MICFGVYEIIYGYVILDRVVELMNDEKLYYYCFRIINCDKRIIVFI